LAKIVSKGQGKNDLKCQYENSRIYGAQMWCNYIRLRICRQDKHSVEDKANKTRINFDDKNIVTFNRSLESVENDVPWSLLVYKVK